MKIVKCDWCNKEFVIGFSIHIRLTSHSISPEANVSASGMLPMLMDQYDVCKDCMQKLLEERANAEYSSI